MCVCVCVCVCVCACVCVIFNNIYNGKISTDEAEMDQSNLLEDMVEFNNKFRPKQMKISEKKKYL